MGDQSQSRNILDIRRQKEFVGREEELTFFREFLESDSDEDQFRMIFNLVGDGGVGKTWLMRQMQQVANNSGVVTTYSDEVQKDLPAVMDHIAGQLEQRDLKMKEFRARYRTYLQNIQKIEADPQAPQGLIEMLGQMGMRAAFVAGDLVPGLRKGLEFLPQDQLETQAGEWLNFLVKKLTNKDDVSLVLEPVQVLTPLFLKDIRGISAKNKKLVLFLDTYEKTGEYLDQWLRDLLSGRYGSLPRQVRLAIAGREGLLRSKWTDFLSIVAYRYLSSFSEGEARDYLKHKGVTDERVVNVILRLSQRLPLLVATLAAESPDDPDKVGEPSGDAIDRFLKWVEDPKRREVALSASLPRSVNRDILAILVEADQTESMFEWLSTMPFVEMSRDGWMYHEVVRSLMLRYKRFESPRSWSELHGRLAEYFESMMAELVLELEQQYENASWQRHALEAGYHRLCQGYSRYRNPILNTFVRTIMTQTAFAQKWAEMIAQAEWDLEIDPDETWGNQLIEGLQAFEENHYQQASQMFTSLLNDVELQPTCRAAALARRGLVYRLAGNFTGAIDDLNEAVKLTPKDVWTLVQRGEAHRQKGEYEEAFEDYDQAIQIDPENTWAMVLKGETYRQLGRFNEALEEFHKATEADPENAWALVLQSETYRRIGRFEEALAGFNRAVGLAPDYVYAITHRGEAYRQMGEVEKAIEDFNRAIELDPKFTWAWVLRGEANRHNGQAEAAIEDFSRAIELEPDDPWPIVLRGEAHRQNGQIQQALADYDRAIELKPDYTWAITLRGETQRQSGNLQEALNDFNQALQNEPENVWTLTLRGETYRQLEDMQAALEDFNKALEIEPDNIWILSFRCQVYRDTRQFEQAIADCIHALEIQPDDAGLLAQRGETYRQMGNFDQALSDLTNAIEKEPNNSWTISRRGETYRQMDRPKESLIDFNRALELDPDDAWAKERRLELYDSLEFRQGAWRATFKDNLFEVYYEDGEVKSQLAALHLNDSYFRLVYGPESGWGTSVILLPVFWSKKNLFQGGQVYAQPRLEGFDLLLKIEGSIGDLDVSCEMRIGPPGEASIQANVRVELRGDVVLDDRPMEAFKPIMLSSMHVSSDVWDAQYAYVGRRPYGIPESGWIILPPESAERFGLRGGRSEWKENAPTIIIQLDRPLTITGWVTPTEDPNDDNVGMWAASDELLHSWEYIIQALAP